MNPVRSDRHSRRCTDGEPPRSSAGDLTLDKFIDAETLAAAPSIAYVTGDPKTVLLTGANGWLGRFLALELLERAAETGGTLITVVRGRDEAAARARLEAAFDSGDPDLLKRFRRLAADHLEVIRGRHRRAESRPGRRDVGSVGPQRRSDRPPGGAGQPRAALQRGVRPQRGGHRRDHPAGDHGADQAGHLPVDRRGRDVGRGQRLRRGRRHPRRQPGAPRRQLVRERLREQQVGRRGAAAGGARPVRPAGRGVPLRHDPRPHPICRAAQRAGRLHPAAAEPSGHRHRAAVVLRDGTPTAVRSGPTTTGCRSISSPSRSSRWPRSRRTGTGRST